MITYNIRQFNKITSNKIIQLDVYNLYYTILKKYDRISKITQYIA